MIQTSKGTVGTNEPTSTPTINAPSTWTGLCHLLDTKSLSAAQACEVLTLARQFRAAWSVEPVPLDLLKCHTMATAFYENSTRTRVSFELAAKRLGTTVVNLDVSSSSMAKGETLQDTGKTLAAMGVNLIVLRHSSAGSAHQLSCAVDEMGDDVHVVNAGDGYNEHPTQALLDLLTMDDVNPGLTNKSKSSPLKVTIIGDVMHSRVARSNIWLLNKFGVNVHVVGPPTLVPAEITKCGATIHHRLEPALQDANFVIVLRMQFERQKEGLIPSVGEYKKLYRLDHARMQLAAPGARILDPGPVNRDLQITSELVDDGKISLISTQVNNGVFVRMAVLYLLLAQTGANT